MKSKITIIFLSLAFLIGCSTSKEPRNLYYAKLEVRQYFEDTTRYLKDVRKVVEEAKQYVEKNLDTSKNNAAIFDVDETSLFNYEYLRTFDFGFTLESWEAWIDSAKAPPIQPVLDLYKFLKSKGIKIFFITGRHESKSKKDIDPTVKNLISVGFVDFDGIFFKPRSPKMKTSEFKSTIRKQLAQQGYFIFINIGDQYSDFEGEYSGKTFKLPNPAYMTF
ncbi:MAG: HAD family acid phosphatase [Ignavibacteria bacterium]|nr:HAD family acid phosphatase [Ignavibacteria bacterium]